jgi:HSP20 family molecular chaperone IbpA
VVQRAEQAQQQRMVQKAAEGTGAEALPQSLLSELASLSKPAAGPAAAGTAQLLGEPLGKASPGSGGSSSSAGGMAQATGQAAQQQGSQQKRPLIQELGAGKSHGLDSQDDGADLIKAVHAVSTSSREADDVPAAAAAAAAGAVDAAPSHTISEVESSGRACVRVSVELPGLASAAGVDLEVEGAVLRLTWGEGARYACIPLPASVDQDGVSARFDKKQRRLVVLLPREEDVQCCSLLGESSH